MSGYKPDIRFYIDWDSNGFNLADEVTEWVMNAGWHIGMHRPYQLVGDETRLNLVLNNVDKRFSPENTVSPYYGNIVPGRHVKIEIVYGGSATTVYYGFVTEIKPTPQPGITCEVSCASPKQYMQDQIVSVPLLQDVRSDEVLAELISRLRTPPTLSDSWILGFPGHSELGETTYLSDLSLGAELDTGDSTFEYVADNWDKDFHGNQYVSSDWESGFKGYDAILDVVKAEQGRFFFNREGKAVFWNRSRLQSVTSLDGSFTMLDFLSNSVKYSYGKHVFNDIRAMAYPRRVDDSESIIWELEEPIEVREDKPKKVTVRYSERDAEESVSALNPNVFEFTHEGDVDYLVEFEARGAKVTFTNNDPEKRTVNTFIIKGQRITDYDKLEVESADATSRSLYGDSELRVDSKLITSEDFAQNIADYKLYRFKDPLGEIETAQFLIQNDGDLARVVNYAIGSKVALSDSQTGHSGEYFIMGEDHQYNKDTGYRVTWYFELADRLSYWLLGVTGFSELGETTRLGL